MTAGRRFKAHIPYCVCCCILQGSGDSGARPKPCFTQAMPTPRGAELPGCQGPQSVRWHEGMRVALTEDLGLM